MKKRFWILLVAFIVITMGMYAKTSHPKKNTGITYSIYVVKKGDTLTEIAQQYHTSVSNLTQLNGLKRSALQVGMKIKVPARPKTTSSSASLKTVSETTIKYVVKKGDTLTSLAKQYHTTPTAIMKASQLKSKSLKVAMILKIPTTKTVNVSSGASATTPSSSSLPSSGTYVKSLQNTPLPPIQVGPCAAWLLLNTNGQLIAGKNINKVWPIASLTKMMTAYVALQAVQQGKVSLTTEYTVPWQATAKTVGGSSAFLYTGEEVTLYELLEGAIMPSGNDAATAIALMISKGNYNDFVAQMNATAQALGMKNTKFYTSCGLPPSMTGGRGMDVSTAADMAILATKLYANSTYIQISKQRYTSIDNGRFQLRNSNQWLLTNVPGVNGMKTGNHDQAKFNVIASVQRGSVGFIVVTLGSPTVEWLHVNPQKIINQAYQSYTAFGAM